MHIRVECCEICPRKVSQAGTPLQPGPGSDRKVYVGGGVWSKMQCFAHAYPCFVFTADSLYPFLVKSLQLQFGSEKVKE